MDAFTTVTLPRVVPLDPTKHVNFTPGMVLGVDDFTQEFTYLSARDQWVARDVAGYGTLWGLGVTVEADRVSVAPGVAISPCGRLICVRPAQCAELDAWLHAHQDELIAGGSSVRLWLVLCYRECLTDPVPIPGEPCRSEDDLTAPGRVADDFKLELRLRPPAQPEEDAIGDFAAWLRAVPVAGEGETGATPAEWAAAVRALAAPAADASPPSPPSPPDDEDAVPGLTIGAPPPGLAIPDGERDAYLRVALRLWVTELRPRLRPAAPAGDCGCGCGGGCGCVDAGAERAEPCDDELLVSELVVPLAWPVGGGVEVGDGGVAVDDERRPHLLHLRLLQELLVGGGGAAGGGAGGGVVGRGQFAGDGTEVWADGVGVTPRNDLSDDTRWIYKVDFAAAPGRGYLVRGTPVVGDAKAPLTSLDVLPGDVVAEDGVFVRVRSTEAMAAPPGFQVEVVDAGALP